MKAKGSGMSVWSMTFVAFLVLKLCGVIAWSWWWVTAPLWIPLAIVVVVVGVVLCIPSLRRKFL